MTDNRKNNKIFSEEDFDKPTPKVNWLAEHLKQIMLGVLIIVCAVLTIIFGPRACSTGEKPVVDTLVTDTLKNDSVTQAMLTDSTKTEPVDSTTIVEEVTNVGSVTESGNDNGNNTITGVVAVSEDVVKEAVSVIRGNYGNNPDRRRRLGDRYQDIQNKVNEMYRNGQVK